MCLCWLSPHRICKASKIKVSSLYTPWLQAIYSFINQKVIIQSALKAGTALNSLLTLLSDAVYNICCCLAGYSMSLINCLTSCKVFRDGNVFLRNYIWTTIKTQGKNIFPNPNAAHVLYSLGGSWGWSSTGHILLCFWTAGPASESLGPGTYGKEIRKLANSVCRCGFLLPLHSLTCMASILRGMSSRCCRILKCHVFILIMSSNMNSRYKRPSTHTCRRSENWS